jgi:hypothetical protein
MLTFNDRLVDRIHHQERVDALTHAKQKRGSNGACATFIRKRVNFMSDHETIFGNWTTDQHGHLRFRVYSYGGHFPMGVWDDESQMWWVHDDRYSRTTSQHQSIFRGAIAGDPQTLTDFDTLKLIAWNGVVEHVTQRLIAA